MLGWDMAGDKSGGLPALWVVVVGILMVVFSRVTISHFAFLLPFYSPRQLNNQHTSIIGPVDSVELIQSSLHQSSPKSDLISHHAAAVASGSLL
jgi:hypothetical protein